jgi:hypothetical protein
MVSATRAGVPRTVQPKGGRALPEASARDAPIRLSRSPMFRDLGKEFRSRRGQSAQLKLRVSIIAAGTHEALHVMRSDPQIASRYEQLELPVWTESQELRRFIAGYLALLPLKKAAADIDKRLVEYLLELSDGVTGRLIDVLRRAALQGLTDKSKRVGLQQLQYVGAHMPAAIGQRT